MSLFDLTADTNSRKLMTLNPEFPKDVETTVIKGNTTSATFSVEIAEHGKPAEYTYQWYVNDAPVEGATNATYEKTGLAETETLTIYCDVTNKKGTVRSRTATLKVTQYYLPVLNSSYPQNATVEKGKSVTSKVTVATAGNPDSYTYQWYKDDKAVSGATSASYTFTPSAVGTTKVYCKVTNSAGTVTSRTATITAIYTLIPGDNVFKSRVTAGGFQEITEKSNNTYQIHIQNAGGCGISIDVTSYKTMEIEGKNSSAKCAARVGLFSATPANDKFITGFKTTTYDGESFSKTYDISSVTGKKYFGVSCTLSDEYTQQLYTTLTKVVFKG